MRTIFIVCVLIVMQLAAGRGPGVLFSTPEKRALETSIRNWRILQAKTHMQAHHLLDRNWFPTGEQFEDWMKPHCQADRDRAFRPEYWLWHRGGDWNQQRASHTALALAKAYAN